jgi:hypothetical protein
VLGVLKRIIIKIYFNLINDDKIQKFRKLSLAGETGELKFRMISNPGTAFSGLELL